MIGKIILFPFWIIGLIFKLGTGIIKLVLSIIMTIFKFITSHIFGTIFGAIIGFFLGKKHIGIKIFPGKKKKK